MSPLRVCKVGGDLYVSVDDLLARTALAATAIGEVMDAGKISREVADGALGILTGLKQGLDDLR